MFLTNTSRIMAMVLVDLDILGGLVEEIVLVAGDMFYV